MQNIILIGSSTGGPGHLQKIVSSLPSTFNATIVIAQHMGAEYLKSFAASLNEISKLTVTLVEDTSYLKNKTIYVCEKNCKFRMIDETITLCAQEDEYSQYNPDISELFSSGVVLCGRYKIMAIILTGIGDDGSSGMLDLSKCASSLIAESQESAIVYGMPMRAKEVVENINVLSLDEIIVAIKEFGAEYV